MKNFSILLIVLLISFSSYAGYVKGKIYFTNGTEIEAFVKFPLEAGDSKINYKTNLKEKPIKISSLLISEMVFISSLDTTIYVYSDYYFINLRKEIELAENKKWLLCKEGKHINYYRMGYKYDALNNGEMLIYTLPDNPNIFVYFKKPNEKIPTYVGFYYSAKYIGLDLRFYHYFRNDTGFLKYIEGKKFTNFYDIQKIYCKYIEDNL